MKWLAGFGKIRVATLGPMTLVLALFMLGAGFGRFRVSVKGEHGVTGDGLVTCPACGQRTAPGVECQWCDEPLGGTA